MYIYNIRLYKWVHEAQLRSLVTTTGESDVRWYSQPWIQSQTPRGPAGVHPRVSAIQCIKQDTDIQHVSLQSQWLVMLVLTPALNHLGFCFMC